MKAMTWTDSGWLVWEGHPCLECETDALVLLFRGEDARAGQGIVLATGEEVASISVGDVVDLAPTLGGDDHIFGYTEWLQANLYPVVRVPLAEYEIFPLRTAPVARDDSEPRRAFHRVAAAVHRGNG